MNADPWVCIGCGKEAVGKVKTCDCPSGLIYQRGDFKSAELALTQQQGGEQEADVEPQARELLAAEYERSNCKNIAELVRSTPFEEFDTRHQVALDAIAAALRTPASEGDGGRVVEVVCNEMDGVTDYAIAAQEPFA